MVLTKGKPSDSTEGDHNIKISVVIPTFNRNERIKACLHALRDQTLPSNEFEVIVVVDGSTDGTYNTLINLETPYELRPIYQENSGPSVARNLGASLARGRFCLFIDDDIIASPELIYSHLLIQVDQHPVVGLGQIMLRFPEKVDRFTYYYGKRWNVHYEKLNSGEHKPTWLDCFSGNLSVPTKSFKEIGGFDGSLLRCNDIELGFRLQKHGLKFTYIPEAKVTQDERGNMSRYMQDAETRGRILILLSERYPDMLPDILGQIIDLDHRETRVHHLLLRFPVPYRFLSFLGEIMPGRQRRYRWFRFLHMHGYWRGMRQAISDNKIWQQLTRGTIILCYHAFSDADESASKYVLPVRKFNLQMAWLKWRGYQVITLEALAKHIAEHQLPPPRSTVLTIDDGYADNLTLAYPILKQYQYPATLFLISDRIGSVNDWTSEEALEGRPLLTRDDIRGLNGNLIQIGAHTRTHPILPTLPKELLTEEIKGSKSDLEAELGIPINLFAYPYGEYDEITISAAETAGFLGSCIIARGGNSIGTSLHTLRRHVVIGTDSFFRFIMICP